MSSLEGDDPAREERLFELHEALQADLEAGDLHADSVYVLRFDLGAEEVARARRALELLCDSGGLELEPPELPAPELPEDYELVEELGRGGMGVVYRVHQKSLDRDLALKVLRPGEAVARRALERFQREARSLARLRHPHIASVHEVGESGGRVYFTMDLIEGRSLAARIQEGGVTPSQAVRWMRQVTSALQYVHSHGLVHRDIKPANILIDESGDACLVDFGLAREVQVASDLTQSGHFLGTPAYMAPEQARGEAGAVGERTDVYAVGAVLYECLTGRRAFDGRSIVEIIAAVCEGDPVPPSRLEAGVPRGLERICLKAMAADREERYVTARALLEDIERFEAGLPVLAEPPSWKKRWRGFVQRNRSSLVAGVGTAAAMVALFVVLVLPNIGSSADQMLSLARELAEGGQPAAAVRIYEGSYPSEAGELSLELVREHGTAYARALVELADLESAAGDLAGVRGLAERADELTRRSLDLLEARSARTLVADSAALVAARLSLLDDAIRARLHLGGEPEVLAGLAERWHELQSGGVRPSLLDAVISEEAWPSEVLLARASLPMLLDRDSQAHGAAILFWGRALDGREHRSVHRWLREELDERAEVLAALLVAEEELRAADGEGAVPSLTGEEAPEWVRSVEACDPRRLREALRAALVENGRNKALRRFAGQLCGLPVEILEGVEVEDVRSLLDTRGYSGEDDLRGRLALVLGVLEERPGLWCDELDAWLRMAMGTPPSGAWPRDLDGWRTSMEGITPAALRSGLEGALARGEVSADLAPGWSLPALGHGKATTRDRQAHERLLFDLPPGAVPPFYPTGLVEVPERIRATWQAALAEVVRPRPWSVRLAALRWELGETEPTLLWEERLDVLEGSEFEHEVELELPELARERSISAGFAGLVDPSARTPDHVRALLRGRLDWSVGGVGLGWKQPRVDGTPVHVRARVPQSWMFGEPERVVVAGQFDLRRRSGLAEVGHELVLARLEHIGYPSEPWGVDRWRERIADEYEQALLRHDGRVASVRSQIAWLARLFLIESEPPAEPRDMGSREIPERDYGGVMLRQWVACADAGQRAPLAERAGLASLPPDLRLILADAALAAGGELDPPTARLVARDRREAQSDSRKATVLWIVAGFVAFLLAGALFAAARGIWRFVKSGEMGRRWRETQADERVYSALAMLPTSLGWVLYADAFRHSSPSGAVVWSLAIALFQLYAAGVLAFLGSGLQSPLRQLPAALLFVSAALLVASNLGLLGAPASETWPAHPAGICLWLGLAVFLLSVRELWSWDTDPALRRQRQRRGEWVYALGVLLPLGWRILNPLQGGPTPFGWNGKLLDAVLTVVPLVGFLGWGFFLFRATRERRNEVMERAKQRARDRWRGKGVRGKATRPAS